MQTMRRESQMRTTFDESAYRFAAVVKAVVCIGFLTLLAAIGFSAGVNDTATAGALSAEPENTSKHVAVRAEAHRKQVFDERRARFEQTAPTPIAPSQEGNKAPRSILNGRQGSARDETQLSTVTTVFETH